MVYVIVERSYEEGQRMPGDYEAQISQGPITVHADEQLGATDGGVVRYRRMLREAIRAVQAGAEPARPLRNADGHVATMAGDVIVRVPISNTDDEALQRRLGERIGAIVESTLPLAADERAGAIEAQVRALLRHGE